MLYKNRMLIEEALSIEYALRGKYQTLAQELGDYSGYHMTSYRCQSGCYYKMVRNGTSQRKYLGNLTGP